MLDREVDSCGWLIGGIDDPPRPQAIEAFSTALQSYKALIWGIIGQERYFSIESEHFPKYEDLRIRVACSHKKRVRRDSLLFLVFGMACARCHHSIPKDQKGLMRCDIEYLFSCYVNLLKIQQIG
jgi:hypothetical protein